MEGVEVEDVVTVLGGLEDYVADLLQRFRGEFFYHLAKETFFCWGWEAGLGERLVDVAVYWEGFLSDAGLLQG